MTKYTQNIPLSKQHTTFDVYIFYPDKSSYDWVADYCENSGLRVMYIALMPPIDCK